MQFLIKVYFYVRKNLKIVKKIFFYTVGNFYYEVSPDYINITYNIIKKTRYFLEPKPLPFVINSKYKHGGE